MSKGNMLLGYARGKVGSLVFARRKGEQVTRPYNSTPNNPRTLAQMSQRMKMYAPVKLYRQSMARFFKYAFVQKQAETVFNAYMRENIAIAPWVSRPLASAGAPIPFPARMSSGSLQPIPTTTGNAANATYESAQLAPNSSGSLLLIRLGVTNEDLTVGEFSEAMIDQFPWLQVGDQITYVIVGATGLSIENGEVLYDDAGNFLFEYARVVLDTTSTVELASLGFTVQALDENSEAVGITLPINTDVDSVAGCIVVTRVNGSAVDASNSSLVLGGTARGIYDIMRTEAYRQKAAITYRVEPDAYLNPASTSNAE